MGSCSGFRVYWITAHADADQGAMGSCSGFRVYWITAHADAEVKLQWVLAQGLGFIGLQHNICND
jgi:hypothetical protein